MIELRLKFKDPEGEEKEVVVDTDKFSIGRHTQCGLCIPDSRLSREHLLIERFGDVFVVSDKGSSNGTILNSEPLEEPKSLENGHKLELGGAVEIVVEMVDPEAVSEGAAFPPPQDLASTPSAAAAAPAPEAGGFPTSLLLIAPLTAVIVIVLVGGAFYIFKDSSSSASSSSKPASDSFDGFTSFDDDSGSRTTRTSKDPDAPTNSGSSLPPQKNEPQPPFTSGSNGSAGFATAPPSTGGDQKVEIHTASFLRRIADNDPKAFVTREQADRIAVKIKQVSGSPSLAANLGNAKKNSQKIAELAKSRNLKPQFLAIAAINRLGANRGDVAHTASGMMEILEKLYAQINTEFADDATLIIAAYNQAAGGEHMKMRNMLQDLSNRFPESTRTIRTIWFLHQNKRITDAEYDSALTFLAIGAISQNPKDFGVNAEALVF